MELTFKEIVGAILVILVIVVSLIYSSYTSGTLSKGNLEFIDKILNTLGIGNKFDYSEANRVAQKSFNDAENTETDLMAILEKCNNSKINNCRCELDLSGFSENHVIKVDKDKLILFDLRKYEKTTSNVKLNETLFSNVNCIWKNKNKNEVRDLEIIFKKENEIIIPKLFYEINWGFDYEENLANVEMYKSNGKLCWIDAESEGFSSMESCI